MAQQDRLPATDEEKQKLIIEYIEKEKFNWKVNTSEINFYFNCCINLNRIAHT